MPEMFSRILSSSQLRTLEAGWISSCESNWGVVLMEVAGIKAARVALNLWNENPGPVVVLCGRGNNGGDGLVVARHLHKHGMRVSVFMVEGTGKALSNECATNQRILESLGTEVQIASASDLEPVKSALIQSTLVVDALLGTGLDRKVEGILAELINLINESGKTVLALDMPSGVNSDSGQIMGCAVQAQTTVTFGFLKAGLLCHPGALHAGEIILADIGMPSIDQLPDSMADFESQLERPSWWLFGAAQAREWLPDRPEDSHKGSYGRLLAIAGSTGMVGAAVLSSQSSLRAGAGLTVLATPKSLLNQIPPSEVICRALSATDAGTISGAASKDLETELETATAVVLGPGLSSNVETLRFVQQLVTTLKKPCVVDADGLNAISQNPKQTFGQPDAFVLTPHPKELSRLLGVSTAEVQSNRIAAAEKAVEKYGCTVVLKGAHSVIATCDRKVYVIPTGNPGMATAGAGDVLTGIIGGLIVQGMKPHEAAITGTYIHGAAGDIAAARLGQDGLIASDIMESVPEAMKRLRCDDFVGTDVELQVLNPI
jgi:ADP-dependent NAD(P)H-hydrate dehydratase / NAD(P)H-hydrate epimerase